MCELKDQDPVITLCAEFEEKYPGFGFEQAAMEILAERQTQLWNITIRNTLLKSGNGDFSGAADAATACIGRKKHP